MQMQMSEGSRIFKVLNQVVHNALPSGQYIRPLPCLLVIPRPARGVVEAELSQLFLKKIRNSLLV